MTEDKAGFQSLLLKILKDSKGPEGKSLFAHLQKILFHIALTDPHSALDKFEEISYEIRKKGAIEHPELFLNYHEYANASQAWATALRAKFFEVT